jgi:L-2-hydroxyglutarate oxidase
MAIPRVGIVGAGIVGLSVARRLQQATSVDVTVIDKEPVVAAHQTGHNSNVVHSGVYYPPGSLKARLCRRGVDLIRMYCSQKGLPYDEIGKVIVAVDDSEMGRLGDLATRAAANGIERARLLDPAELREREPHVRGRGALLIPDTAVVDYRLIADQLAVDIVAGGGEVKLGRRVVGLRTDSDGTHLATDSEESRFDHVVVCAGLQSSRVAQFAGASPDPEIIPFRGEYYELVIDRRDLIRGLVYPVPDPRYPFLGVHFTSGLDGHVYVGPNAVLAMAQEGYRWTDVRWRDLWRMARYPGMYRLARQHWRMGASEIAGSLSKGVFLRRARRYVPELEGADLVRSGAGVRAQAVRRDGSLVDDFVIDTEVGVTFVRNAPSPAATASPAIAEYIVGKLPLAAEARRRPAV